MIERYTYPKVFVYNIQNKLVFVLNNSVEILRFQIKMLKKYNGNEIPYYLMVENKDIKIEITKHGELKYWPEELRDEQKHYAHLFKIRKNILDEEKYQKSLKQNEI